MKSTIPNYTKETPKSRKERVSYEHGRFRFVIIRDKKKEGRKMPVVKKVYNMDEHLELKNTFEWIKKHQNQIDKLPIKTKILFIDFVLNMPNAADGILNALLKQYQNKPPTADEICKKFGYKPNLYSVKYLIDIEVE